MPSLRERQQAFVAAALFGDADALSRLAIAAGALDASACIDVYRNNILGNYRKVLAATFPVVHRLVGAPFFTAAADEFVRAHPSRGGDVNRYGGDFPSFLASYRPARELGYLADVARLEWAIDQANIAADAAALDLSALAAVPQDALAQLRFRLHPSVHLVSSPFPILHIWRMNQPGHEADDRVDLGEGPDALVVARGEQGVAIERLDRGEYALLDALHRNATLGVAAGSAADVQPDFDLAGALRRHVTHRVVVAFGGPDDPAPGGDA